MKDFDDGVIISSPYYEPTKHWDYSQIHDRPVLADGRRPSGFFLPATKSRGRPTKLPISNTVPNSVSHFSSSDHFVFKELKPVNDIRNKIKKWRADNYPGITSTTRDLLRHWNNEKSRSNRLFFCQLEAIETMIWLTETTDGVRERNKLPMDGGPFTRLCSKMATGTGKTLVMAMLISWQILNSAVNPTDKRFSKNILIIAPNITVRSRLSVLKLSKFSIYTKFNLLPKSYYRHLYDGSVVIHNWHVLERKNISKHRVVKFSHESQKTACTRILDNSDARGIVVINDEAHHAYRLKYDNRLLKKDERVRNRLWIEGLDMIHHERGIMQCFDFSATPYTPTGKDIPEDAMFDWIVSDFSLFDAIESGLTKTPGIAISDNSNTKQGFENTKFFHIFRDKNVRRSLTKKPSQKSDPLPQLVTNAYKVLGEDWIETWKKWTANNFPIPPVMITVCNSTDTAARITHSFLSGKLLLPELSNKSHILHVDSVEINKLRPRHLGVVDTTSKNHDLRLLVDTIGLPGEPGEKIRNIVAVQMLSEGWDARNVTHIMGLRAFTSQLLCEQVVGRGLRRMTYEADSNGMLPYESVNVFGVPFSLLPQTIHRPSTLPDPPVYDKVLDDRIQHEIIWPNVERVDIELSPLLTINWSDVKTLELSVRHTATTVHMTDLLPNKPVTSISKIDLHDLDVKIRLQQIIFLASKDVFDSLSQLWPGDKNYLIFQVVLLVEEFLKKEKVVVTDVLNDPLKKNFTIMLNMASIVEHVCSYIKNASKSTRRILLSRDQPKLSTSNMEMWATQRKIEKTTKSHINFAVCDSTWEELTVKELEQNPRVVSWVKNDHIGFFISYNDQGVIRQYYPDFLIKLVNNVMLILEVKGLTKQSTITALKKKGLEDWVDAVNDDGHFGVWRSDIVYDPSHVGKIICRYATLDVNT